MRFGVLGVVSDAMRNDSRADPDPDEMPARLGKPVG
jgi:hypothetical protein